ncbi:MAG: hypothetical protein ABFD66_15490 [Smithella sp.]
MADEKEKPGRVPFVWVKDKAGNEFICQVDALKDPKKATEEELKNCVNDAKSPQPFAGG